jgi:hypothetical protein
MNGDWTDEMQAQFDELRRDLADVIKAELRSSEERLARHIDEQLSTRFETAEERLSAKVKGVEDRLSHQYKASVEGMGGQVRLLAEAFGGTLDAIRADIHELKGTFEDTMKLHAQVLTKHSRDIATHSRDIDELKRRSGH